MPYEYTQPLPFASADEAAMAFYQEYLPISLYVGFECCTTIVCREVGGVMTYDYSAPYWGTPHNVTPRVNNLPPYTKIVAFAHTHPETTGFSGNLRSKSGDVGVAFENGRNIYLAEPDKIMRVYDVNTWMSKDIEPISNLNDSFDREYWANKFKSRWERHICLEQCYTCAIPPAYQT